MMIPNSRSAVSRTINRQSRSSPIAFHALMLFLLFLLILFDLHAIVLAQCPKDCSQHGLCSIYGDCTCFEGWEGLDCSRRSCAKGPAFSSIPYANDRAHEMVECSGQGLCDYQTGLCKCYSGFSGHNCGRNACLNGCSGNGECISLGTAAEENDGYALNRTTKYALWDAERIFGCKCNYGYAGVDCSQRVCEYGPDPRLSRNSHESIKLVCDCRKNCDGRFKLRFFGSPIRVWLNALSTTAQLAEAITTAPGIYKFSKTQSTAPVYIDQRLGNESICVRGQYLENVIKFRRNAGDLPAISFYASTMGSSLYLQTEQYLRCNCLDFACNGTYRVSFDGEMSPKLHAFGDGSQLVQSLNNMKTVRSAGYIVSADSYDGPLCSKGQDNNITLYFRGNSANAQQLAVWSSVVFNDEPYLYTTANASNVLTITTNDGRDDHMKLCNGIGRCDFSTGLCACPYGWGPDPNWGSCGALVVNTSQWQGLARCPGVINYNTIGSVGMASFDDRMNFKPRFYLSFDPYSGTGSDNSEIWYFLWRSETIRGAKIDATGENGKLFLKLTSDQSAGPIVLDQAKDQIIFIDNNPEDGFIGLASQYNTEALNYTRFYTFGDSYQVFGLTLDTHFSRRKLYWTVPGLLDQIDGEIYWAYIDENNPTIYTLTSVVGWDNIVSPFGIAIHYVENRIYWVDREPSNEHSVLNSCDFDGNDFKQRFVFREGPGSSSSLNVTDLVIHFTNNNTALLIDAKPPASIIALSLNAPVVFPKSRATIYEGYLAARVITNYRAKTIVTPKYLAIDDWAFLVLWTDYDELKVNYDRYRTLADDLYSPGTAFAGRLDYFYRPVGIALDRGLGAPQWSNYLECYGNGICTGLEGKWTCNCYEGFSGDCQARSCPKGRAWFHEPAIDNVAHDEFVECSNMGLCDRGTGSCSCAPGFEGAACERLACPNSGADTCFKRGRCLSMRQLAYHHRDKYLDPQPVEYGMYANDPLTWDADMIYGCLPDEYGSFNGEYNVSNPTGRYLDKYICPVTYNPRYKDLIMGSISSTVPAVNQTMMLKEIQQLVCDADSGKFKLSFRGFVSDYIPTTATAEEFRAALQAMPTVGKVEVSLSHDTLCSGSGAYYANVTFLHRMGLLPLFKVADKSLLMGGEENVYISRIQTGSPHGLVECGGRGECNQVTGKCRCFDGYGTSDGFGNPGVMGDCGASVIV